MQAASQRAEPAGRKSSHKKPAAFDGDVSEWGRKEVEGFYDDVASELGGPEASELSSAISPRDTRPRTKPFDMEEATQTLAYQSGMFSRAQALRRDGCAPAAMGVPDDLPTRMAYEQLNVLAGMAGKVQDAIIHSKCIFEQRLMSEGRALQRRVLHGWLTVRQRSAAKQALLARVQGRLRRGLLLRCFFSWKDELHHDDKTLAMKRKVAVVTGRGCVRRCFAAWLVLARERWWKSQLSSMESQVGLMEAKLRGYEKRPIQVLRKRRLSQLLCAWLVEALWAQHKRRRQAKAVGWRRQNLQQQAWAAWVALVASRGRQHRLSARVASSCGRIKQQAALAAWLQAVELRHLKQLQLQAASQHCQRATCSKVLRAWRVRARQNRSGRAAAQRWKRPCVARAFKLWLWYAGSQRRQRLALSRALARRQHMLLQGALSCWGQYVEQRKVKRQLGQQQGLQDELERIKAENARLQRDNERFVRLVDSGEWGRQRVGELVAAGELMRAERDALLKLVQALRREYEAVQLTREAQHDEFQSIKDKMTVKGPARNCLLVKGGSSFNALVRAMKQDLIDSGTATKDPALLYQIDKLSLDRVQVYPDGELNIQAVASGPQATSSSKGGSHHHHHQQQQQQNQQQQRTQPSSPAARPQSASRARVSAHRLHTQSNSPNAATVAAEDVNPQLRIAVGNYANISGGSNTSNTSSPKASSSQAGGYGLMASNAASSPTRMAAAAAARAAVAAAAGAKLNSPQQAGSPCGSPLRQPGPQALAAAAAAAAAAVASRGILAGQQQCSPQAALLSTDGMLNALSNLTPAQVQARLAAATAAAQQQR